MKHKRNFARTSSHWIQPFFVACLVVCIGCGKAPIPEPKTPLRNAKKLVVQQKYDEARAICERLVQDEPDNLDAILLLEETYRKLGDRELAIQACTQAIAVAPNDPEAYHRRHEHYRDVVKELADQADEEKIQAYQEAELADYQAYKQRLAPDDRKLVEQTSARNRKKREFVVDMEPTYTATPPAEMSSADTPPPTSFTELEAELQPAPSNAAATSDSITLEANRESEPRRSSKKEDEAYAARLAEEERAIREKELGDEPDEVVLPPHEDPETSEPIAETPIPPRPIARMALPRLEDGRPILPNLRGTASTGLRQPSENESSTEFDEERPITNRFLRTNRFGIVQQGVRTGIGSSPSSSGSTGWSANRTFQSGLIPPEARGSFGPRIAPELANTADETATERPSPQRSRPNRQSNRRTGSGQASSYSMALPGTEIPYGAGAGLGRSSQAPGPLSMARPPATTRGVGNRLNRANRFGNITDPNFTPFGVRQDQERRTTTPSLPASPSLPTLGSSSRSN